MEDIKVIEWLNYCDENNIKPWLWDFKNCYSTELTSDSITNFLKYKKNQFKALFFFAKASTVRLVCSSV